MTPRTVRVTTVLVFGLVGFGFAQTPATTPQAPTPEGKIAFISIGESFYDIFTINPDGTERTQLTFDGADKGGLEWSPDGTQIVFAGDDASGQLDIYLMHSNGSGLVALTTGPAEDSSPAFSPDSTQICFASNREGNNEIYLMNVDGTGVRRLTDSSGFDGWCDFSPDGSQIAFESSRSGNRDIWVMNRDGSDPRPLTEAPTDDFYPAWSPDGRWIAFAGIDRDGTTNDSEIFIMQSEGVGEHQLSRNEIGVELHPTWSPDGKKIAFMTADADDPTDAIAIMNLDGTGLVVLDSPFDDNGPDWQPVAQPVTTTSFPIINPTSRPTTTQPLVPAPAPNQGIETWKTVAFSVLGILFGLVLLAGWVSFRTARKEGRPWR